MDEEKEDDEAPPLEEVDVAAEREAETQRKAWMERVKQQQKQREETDEPS